MQELKPFGIIDIKSSVMCCGALYLNECEHEYDLKAMPEGKILNE